MPRRVHSSELKESSPNAAALLLLLHVDLKLEKETVASTEERSRGIEEKEMEGP
jgi:hypothetical protein